MDINAVSEISEVDKKINTICLIFNAPKIQIKNIFAEKILNGKISTLTYKDKDREKNDVDIIILKVVQ